MHDKMMSEVLGGTYGGPSIGYEGGKFVLYEWFDGPVCDAILLEADTWCGLMEKMKDYHSKQKEAKNG